MKLALALLAVFALCANAAPFLNNAEPGKGSLKYQKGENSEQVEFGNEHGHYLMGVAIPRKLLPEPVQSDFKSDLVLQVTMADLKKGTPPFGAMTLLIDKIPKGKTTLKVRIPESKEKGLRNLALVMFSSPSVTAAKNDEERLKQTYFGSAGNLTLTPIGISKVQKLDVPGGKALPFRTLKLKADVTSELNTPFNPQAHQLTGSVEFFVYWPEGKDSETYAKQLSLEMLPSSAKATN